MFFFLAWWLLSGCALLVHGADLQSPDLQLQQALALHQKGDFEGAIAGYRAYLKLRPNAIDARSNLGAALARLGRYDEAITEYKRALQKESANPGVRLNLGLAYYKL